MDTKKIVNQISNQISVNDMKKELNDLKLLFNSLETKICQFKQSLKFEKDLLKQTEATLENQLLKAKEKADGKFQRGYKNLNAQQKKALNNLNEAINRYNEAEKRLFGKDDEIRRTKDTMKHMQKFYDQITIDIELYKQRSASEFSNINSDVINGYIYSNNYDFFANDDIDTLNELLLSIKELKTQIDSLESAISASMAECDETAQKIVALNDSINKTLAEREVYKMVIDSAAKSAKTKTAETVGEITSGVEKGLKGATTIGKGLYTFAKKKANAYIQSLEEDDYDMEEQFTENSVEVDAQNLDDIEENVNDKNIEQGTSFNDDTSAANIMLDNYINAIASAVGLDPDAIEKSKKLTKSLFDKFNNGNKE